MSNFETPANGPKRDAEFFNNEFENIAQQTDWISEIKHQYEYLASHIIKYVDLNGPETKRTGGFVFMSTYTNDGELSILFANHPRIVSKNRTAIVINKFRSAEPSEPGFPDGKVLEMTDIMVKQNKLGLAHEVQYRDHHKHHWDTPSTTTLLLNDGASLHGFGNLLHSKGSYPQVFLPKNAYYEPDILANKSNILWDAVLALKSCGARDVHTEYKNFSN